MFFPFFAGKTSSASAKPPLVFFNTLTGSRERFTPWKKDYVRLYSCGPTVYDYAHIGNLRPYVFSDLIRRTLCYNGYKVKQVVNLTDIGHLVADADVGEDKMALAIQREGEEMSLDGLKRVADKYIAGFLEDLDALNVRRPHALPRPSECIPEQIALIHTLMEKEYAYATSDGVYFDTKRFKEYGKLGHIDVHALLEGARVASNPEKRNPTDFALWKRGGALGWESPWGRGFPGWHIECSAMAMSHLGKQIDIHTGGIDHIPVHHNNEIAQSEAATGKQFVRFWMHNAFITVNEKRIGKSEGNAFHLRHLVEKGYNPLVYRYWLLTAHYRSPVDFSWGAIEGCAQALKRLRRMYFTEWDAYTEGSINEEYGMRFLEAINDDLDTPRALSLVWELVKDTSIDPASAKATLARFDEVLGIGFKMNPAQSVTLSLDARKPVALHEIPEEVRLLVIARDEMREARQWEKADELRGEIDAQGFMVEDHPEGVRVFRRA